MAGLPPAAGRGDLGGCLGGAAHRRAAKRRCQRRGTERNGTVQREEGSCLSACASAARPDPARRAARRASARGGERRGAPGGAPAARRPPRGRSPPAPHAVPWLPVTRPTQPSSAAAPSSSSSWRRLPDGAGGMRRRHPPLPPPGKPRTPRPGRELRRPAGAERGRPCKGSAGTTCPSGGAAPAPRAGSGPGSRGALRAPRHPWHCGAPWRARRDAAREPRCVGPRGVFKGVPESSRFNRYRKGKIRASGRVSSPRRVLRAPGRCPHPCGAVSRRCSPPGCSGRSVPAARCEHTGVPELAGKGARPWRFGVTQPWCILTAGGFTK